MEKGVEAMRCPRCNSAKTAKDHAPEGMDRFWRWICRTCKNVWFKKK